MTNWVAFFYYHYLLVNLKIFDALHLVTVISLINAQIVPSLASESLFKLLLSPYDMTLVVIDSFCFLAF